MNNEPVAWWTGEFNDEADDFMFDSTKQKHINHVNSRTHEFFPIPLYTHPHPDNLGLAESIIKQQELQIEALKEELKKSAEVNRLLAEDIGYEE